MMVVHAKAVVCILFLSVNIAMFPENKMKQTTKIIAFLKLIRPWKPWWVRTPLCIFIPAHLDICLIFFPCLNSVNILFLVLILMQSNPWHTCLCGWKEWVIWEEDGHINSWKTQRIIYEIEFWGHNMMPSRLERTQGYPKRGHLLILTEELQDH